MSRLNKAARERIKASGLTIARYVRFHFPGGRWGGDACGCSDDRCKDGFHHHPDEECGCLPVLIEQVLRDDDDMPADGPVGVNESGCGG